MIERGDEFSDYGQTEVDAHDPSHFVTYEHFTAAEGPKKDGRHKLKMPTLAQLLTATFKERQYLLSPWLRAATGVGKSLFAMSAALAVAGGGEFLGWQSDPKPNGEGWQVLYVDGEMHIGDLQERARQLREGIPNLDKAAADKNLRFFARQHQDAGVQFPSVTEAAGQSFVLDQIKTSLTL